MKLKQRLLADQTGTHSVGFYNIRNLCLLHTYWKLILRSYAWAMHWELQTQLVQQFLSEMLVKF